MSLRILIADDHGVMRAGLRALLNAEADLEVVGEAATSDDALRLVTQLCPDIVLMDISMPGPAGNGIEVTRRMREIAPAARVLILTMHEDKGLLREAVKAGASGYILKRAAEAELKGAIDTVAGGDLYIHPSMVRALIAEATPAPVVRKVDAEGLSPREMDILRLIVQGYTNHQMADELNISVRTVESHRANLMSKLNVRSRVELVRYARSRGLMEPA
jgi:two-component system, NarL family, response regulator NreC